MASRRVARNALPKANAAVPANREKNDPRPNAKANAIPTRAALGNISNKAAVCAAPGNRKVANAKDVDGKLCKHGKANTKEVEMCKAAVVVEEAALPAPTFQSAREPSVESEAAAVAPVEPVDEIREAAPMEDDEDYPVEEDEDEEVDPYDEHFSAHNIDVNDLNNPQLMSIYAAEIYDYIRTTEAQYPIREHFLDGQIAVAGWMRAILLDWLVQVQRRFLLHQETLYLTVAIIDRYLQEVTTTTKDKLQLVGVTAMLIACKYEEVFAPEVADFEYITDHAYTTDEIRQMECDILRVLKFELGRPIALHFLRRYSKAAEADAKLHTLAKYLMELSLMDYELAHIPPSHIAAAALCLSMRLLSTNAITFQWTPTLVYHSKYAEAQLIDVMLRLGHLAFVAPTGKRTAVYDKYSSHRLLHTSQLPELSLESIDRVRDALRKDAEAARPVADV